MFCLVADDDETIHAVIETYLKPWGFEIESAYDGQEAIEKLKGYIKEGRKVNLILSDYMMPKVDGFDFLMRVRSLPEMEHTAFVIITGHDKDEDKERARMMMANGYLAKPFTKVEVNKIMEALFPRLEEAS